MEFAALLASLKRAAAVLRDAGVPFAVAGGLAVYARGGPAHDDDIDLVLRRDDIPRALEALTAAGMRHEDPPEEWLTKVYDGPVLIDLIFAPTGLEVDGELLARAEERPVEAVTMPLLPLEDVLVTQLLSVDERTVGNYRGLLEAVRLVREQIDWDDVRCRTASSPFARAFLVLLEGLDVIPAAEAALR